MAVFDREIVLTEQQYQVLISALELARENSSTDIVANAIDDLMEAIEEQQ
jgi:hypothetical protein